MLTTGVDVADGSGSSHDGVADTFKFTNGNEKIVLNNDGSGNYDVKSLSAKDSLKDVSTTDNDILQLNFALAAGSNIIGAKNIGSGVTIENIEEIDIIGSGANRTVFDNTLKATGLKTLKISGDFVGFDFNGKVIKDLTKIDATGITSVKSGVTLDASGAKQSLTIDGPNFAATVKGGAGDDIITAQGSVDGGAGNDIITAQGSVYGGAGNDIIYYTGESTVNGGAGDDIIEAAANAAEGAVVIDGDAGKDLITVNGEATVNGDNDDDIITINGAADVSVNGGSGKDMIIFAEGYAGTGTVGDLESNDILEVNAGVINATIGATYTGDASHLSVVSGATLNLIGISTSTSVDLSASKIAEDVAVKIDLSEATAASLTTIAGSKGIDTLIVKPATGAVDLSGKTLSSIEVLQLTEAGTGETKIAQGTNINTVETTAGAAALGASGTFVLNKGNTKFIEHTSAETSVTEAGGDKIVNAVGEWSYGSGTLTYFDEVLGQDQTITFTGATDNWKAKVESGGAAITITYA